MKRLSIKLTLFSLMTIAACPLHALEKTAVATEQAATTPDQEQSKLNKAIAFAKNHKKKIAAGIITAAILYYLGGDDPDGPGGGGHRRLQAVSHNPTNVNSNELPDPFEHHCNTPTVNVPGWYKYNPFLRMWYGVAHLGRGVWVLIRQGKMIAVALVRRGKVVAVAQTEQVYA